MIKKLCMCIIVLFSIASCAPTTNQNLKKIDMNGWVGNKNVYAQIEKNNNKYIIKSIDYRHGNVLLNDLSPHNIDMKTVDCGTVTWFQTDFENKACTYEFRSRYPSRLGVDVVTHVLTFGIMLPLGFHGSASAFDYEKFNVAVTEALSASSIDRVKLLKEIDDYIGRSRTINQPQVFKEFPNYRSLSETEREKYLYEIERIASMAFKIKVVDQSGFWKGPNTLENLNEINFKVDASLVGLPRFISPDYKYYKGYTGNSAGQELLPVVNMNTFIENLKNANEKLEIAKVENPKIDKFNELEFERAYAVNEKTFADYKGYLSHRNGKVQVDNIESILKKMKYEDYISTIKFENDPIVIKNGVVTAGGEVTLTITGRSFKNILPKTYDFNNNDMSVHLRGNELKVTNKTNSYISLDALTLYHQNDVLTLGGENLREIPPGSFITIFLHNFNIDRLSNSYTNINKNFAQKTNIKFGFASKYRRTDLTQAKSFVEINNYNLYDMIVSHNLVAMK